LKPTFGFIQPIFEEEQIYCSSRDYFVDIKLGDRVGFVWRSSSKGDFAEKLRHLTQVVCIYSIKPFHFIPSFNLLLE